MDAAGWDERYAASDLVWSAGCTADPDQVAAALPRLRIQKAERVRRPVEIDGTTRHAIDTLVRASAPAAPAPAGNPCSPVERIRAQLSSTAFV